MEARSPDAQVPPGNSVQRRMIWILGLCEYLSYAHSSGSRRIRTFCLCHYAVYRHEIPTQRPTERVLACESLRYMASNSRLYSEMSWRDPTCISAHVARVWQLTSLDAYTLCAPRPCAADAGIVGCWQSSPVRAAETVYTAARHCCSIVPSLSIRVRTVAPQVPT